MKPLDAKSPTLLHNAQQVLFVLFGIMVILAPLYFQPTIGTTGTGISLGLNAASWIVALFIIASGFITSLTRNKIIIPKYSLIILLFPIEIITTGFISGVENNQEWIIRISCIVGGVILFFSLLQFKLTEKKVENLIYLLISGIGIAGIISATQLKSLDFLSFLSPLPISNRDYTYGIFMQKNVNASYMATGLLLSFFVATSNYFSSRKPLIKSIPIIVISICSFNIITCGSRVGVLGLILGLVILIPTRFSNNKAFTYRLIIIFLSIFIGVYGGIKTTNGAIFTIEKIDRLSQSRQDARIHIYSIAWNVFKESPWIGHGIGSFTREFQKERIDYYQKNPDYVIDDKVFTHPHNEFLYWLDEAGITPIIFIIIFGITITIVAIKQGRNGIAFLSILAPITLHTQVEYPFYISSIHWIVFIFLIYCIFNKNKTEKNINISKQLRILTKYSALIIPIFYIFFIIHTQISALGIAMYYSTNKPKIKYLEAAERNFYLSEISNRGIWQAFFYSQVKKQSHYKIDDFIRWTKNYAIQSMQKSAFTDLAKAYLYQGNSQQAIETINLAHSIYPSDENILAQKLFISEQIKAGSKDILEETPQKFIDAARKAIDPSHVPYNTTPK